MSFFKEGVEYITVTEDDWLAVEQLACKKSLSFAGLFLLAGVGYRRGISAYGRARLHGKTEMQLGDWTQIRDALIQAQRALKT